MEPFELVNHAVALVTPYLPRVAEPGPADRPDAPARALFGAIERALLAHQGHDVLRAFINNPADNAAVKRILRSAVRARPADNADLTTAVVAMARATAPASIPHLETTRSPEYGSLASGDKTRGAALGGAVAGAGPAGPSRSIVIQRPAITITAGGILLAIGLVVVLIAALSGAFGGLNGDSTCADYANSNDAAKKAAVMQQLYRAQNKPVLADDPFIVIDTELACGNRRGMTLSQVAAINPEP